jgi:hypothetical protein
MGDYRYEVDLAAVVRSALPWPEKRSALVDKIQGSLWLHDVMLAAGESYPFNGDAEDPDEPELCCAAEMLSQLETAPGEDAWFAVLEHFSSLFAYDRVQVRHGRHLSLA